MPAVELVFPVDVGGVLVGGVICTVSVAALSGVGDSVGFLVSVAVAVGVISVGVAVLSAAFIRILSPG